MKRPWISTTVLAVLCCNAVYAAGAKANGNKTPKYPIVATAPYQSHVRGGDGQCSDAEGVVIGPVDTNDVAEVVWTPVIGSGTAVCEETWVAEPHSGYGAVRIGIVRHAGYTRASAFVAGGISHLITLSRPAIDQAFEVTFEIDVPSASVDPDSSVTHVILAAKAQDGIKENVAVVYDETVALYESPSGTVIYSVPGGPTPPAGPGPRTVTLTLRPEAGTALSGIRVAAYLYATAWDSGPVLAGTRSSGAQGEIVLKKVSVRPAAPLP